jgi:hypothetical protein
MHFIIMSGIAPKQNAFKFKIAPHKQKPIVKKIGRKMSPPPPPPPSLANGALCLSTPKHNGKSGTDKNTLWSFELK